MVDVVPDVLMTSAAKNVRVVAMVEARRASEVDAFDEAIAPPAKAPATTSCVPEGGHVLPVELAVATRIETLEQGFLGQVGAADLGHVIGEFGEAH